MSKVRLAEVKLKNDCFIQPTMGYFNVEVKGSDVEILELDWTKREITVKLRGQPKFQVPYENIVYKRNLDMRKVPKKEPVKEPITGLDKYPGDE